jgi:HD-like signal output (HDOD) protein
MTQEMTDKKLKSINEWVAFFKSTEIPVLKSTLRALTELQQDDEKLGARAISLAILGDPMMVFRVLSYAQQHKGRSQLQDLLQVEQAVIMMGTTAFFKNLMPVSLVEKVLSSQLVALTHLLKHIKRAHRAAYFAADWAVYHKDYHAEEVRIAALLHDLAEMLMWCFAPEKMNEIFNQLHANKTLRSATVQECVLGFKLHDLQSALVEQFKLPPLLSKLMDDDHAEDSRVKNVVLAVNFARHSANGWDDAALPDDYAAIAEFLHVDVQRAMRLLGVPPEQQV